jgi:hypothetical protein
MWKMWAIKFVIILLGFPEWKKSPPKVFGGNTNALNYIT